MIRMVHQDSGTLDLDLTRIACAAWYKQENRTFAIIPRDDVGTAARGRERTSLLLPLRAGNSSYVTTSWVVPNPSTNFINIH